MGIFAHIVACVGVPDAGCVQSAVGSGDCGDLICPPYAAVVEHGRIETRIPALIRLGLIIAGSCVDDRLKVLIVSIACDRRLSICHLVGIDKFLGRASAGRGASAHDRNSAA